MGRRRVAEHIGSIANGGDDGGARFGQLHAQGSAHGPAQSARRAVGKIVGWCDPLKFFKNQRIFVDHHGIGVAQFIDASRDPLAAHGGGGFGCPGCAQAALGAELRDLGASQIDAQVECRIGGADHPVEFPQATADFAGDGHIGTKTADRITPIERIDSHMHDLAICVRCDLVWYPRNVRFKHQDQVGVAQQFGRVEAAVHRMGDWQAQVARAVLHDRQREPLCDRIQRRRRVRMAPGVGGDQQRGSGLADPLGQLCESPGVGLRSRGGNDAGRGAGLWALA